jgi:hypothetical protein
MVYYVIAMALYMQVAYREGGETHGPTFSAFSL